MSYTVSRRYNNTNTYNNNNQSRRDNPHYHRSPEKHSPRRRESHYAERRNNRLRPEEKNSSYHRENTTNKNAKDKDFYDEDTRNRENSRLMTRRSRNNEHHLTTEVPPFLLRVFLNTEGDWHKLSSFQSAYNFEQLSDEAELQVYGWSHNNLRMIVTLIQDIWDPKLTQRCYYSLRLLRFSKL